MAKVTFVIWCVFLLAERGPAGAQSAADDQARGSEPTVPASAAERQAPPAVEETPTPPAGEAPIAAKLQAALARLVQAVSALESVALISLEASGTSEDTKGLEQAICDRLAALGKPRLVAPEEVLRRAGVEFAVSTAGIAKVAEKVEVQAAVFPRLFATGQELELQLWVVEAAGTTLLDETFPLDELPPAKDESQARPLPAPAAAALPPPVDSGAWKKRVLALAPRTRGSNLGVGIGFSTGNVAMGFHGGGEVWLDWLVTEGGNPISEKRLVELAGREDLAQRMQRTLGRYTTLRNVGIGMTLAGFVTAGVAAPYFKQGTDQGLTGAGVAVGLGLAVGAAGLVLWINYASMVAGADSPWPAHHLISQEEAEEMIEQVNDRLLREIGLPEPTGAGGSKSGLQFSITPAANGAALFFGAVF